MFFISYNLTFSCGRVVPEGQATPPDNILPKICALGCVLFSTVDNPEQAEHI